VKVRDGNRITNLVQDKRLRWPDTFSEAPDGTIYVTSSRIQDMNWFKPESGPRLETQLWRIEPRPNGEATGSTGQPQRP
jgi:sugar lactone lactonase YvrE